MYYHPSIYFKKENFGMWQGHIRITLWVCILSQHAGVVNFGNSYQSPNYSRVQHFLQCSAGVVKYIQSRAPVIAIGYT